MGCSGFYVLIDPATMYILLIHTLHPAGAEIRFGVDHKEDSVIKPGVSLETFQVNHTALQNGRFPVFFRLGSRA